MSAITDRILDVKNEKYHVIHVDRAGQYIYAIDESGKGKYFPL